MIAGMYKTPFLAASDVVDFHHAGIAKLAADLLADTRETTAKKML